MWFSPNPCHHQGVRDPCSCPKEVCPGHFSLETATRRAKDENILRKFRIISVPIHCQLISRKRSIRCNWNFHLVDCYRCATYYQAPKTLPNLGWETSESDTKCPPSFPFLFPHKPHLNYLCTWLPVKMVYAWACLRRQEMTCFCEGPSGKGWQHNQVLWRQNTSPCWGLCLK